MPDVSPLLALPLIQPSQAQKHVTHNEALDRLDRLVQLVVEAFEATLPPVDPPEGAVWALGAAPTGVWAAGALQLASWRNGAWVFAAPAQGWRAWGRAEAQMRVFSGTGWAALLSAADLQNLAGLGLNTTSDATNRLAVSAAASLLSHEGAGHQLKINKATAGDTASLLFQTGFSGRAEMGLAGSDEFAIKVSADGSSFATGVSVAATGAVSLPGGLRLADGSAAAPGLRFAADGDTGLLRPATNQIGFATGGVQRALLSTSALQVNLPITGMAVTQSAIDATAGRLMKVGDFGLGTAGPTVMAAIDDFNIPSGIYGSNSLVTTGIFPPGATVADLVLNLRPAANQTTQILSGPNITGQLWHRRSNGMANWNPWRRLFDTGNLLGTVSQSAGVPTGAVIERGANANGEYIRYADGTQMCWTNAASSSSADTTWTFPAVFTGAVRAMSNTNSIADGLFGACRVPTTTSVAFNQFNTSAARVAGNTALFAIGRWF